MPPTCLDAHPRGYTCPVRVMSTPAALGGNPRLSITSCDRAPPPPPFRPPRPLAPPLATALPSRLRPPPPLSPPSSSRFLEHIRQILPGFFPTQIQRQLLLWQLAYADPSATQSSSTSCPCVSSTDAYAMKSELRRIYDVDPILPLNTAAQQPDKVRMLDVSNVLNMENRINSLTFKGSIPDAINQSRREKKLFVVYISGVDESSCSLEQSALIDEHVAEVIGRRCIFLHLTQGNVEALQFSAIYPQKSIPSISVVGLNGVMLWNHEGYISPEDLKESIEKAWATLQLQETAATLLTVSLASRMAEPANTDLTTLPANGGSSLSENLSNLSSQSTGSSAASGFDNSTDLVAQPPSSISHAELLKISEKENSESDSTPGNRTVEDKPDLASKDAFSDCSRSSNMDSYKNPNQKGSRPSPIRKNKVDGSSATVLSEPLPSITTCRCVSSHLPVEQDKATTSTPIELNTNSATSDDIQLVIRMPNGPSLQIKLTKDDVLRKVKNFVDENQGSQVGSYNLAMLYPRKLFTEQDMETTLYELGIETRQALVVIPHRQSVEVARHQSSSPSSDLDHNMDADNSVGWAYFGYLGTALSYVNPLSYLRGNPTSSNPEQLGDEGSQQHRLSPGPWNRPGMEAASEHQPLPSIGGLQAAGHSSENSLRRRPRQFGGNIHTLSSEEHGPSDDKNVFWNGNSTEFGGDDKK